MKHLKSIIALFLCSFAGLALYSWNWPFFKAISQKDPRHTMISLDQNNEYIDIKASYPEFCHIDPSVNKLIKESILTEINDFKEGALKDYQEFLFNEERQKDESPYLESGIEITPTIIQASKKYISVQFEGFLYLHASAHPSQWWQSFNYDIENKKVMTLADLFPDDSGYLHKIAYLCEQELKKNDWKFEEYNLYELIEQGTKPIINNYETFTFTDDEITLYFQQYQVCPYSEMPTVTLKRTDIQNVRPNNLLKDVKSFVQLLPINVAKKDGERINLCVEIPEKFRALQDITAPFVEFIPEHDDEYLWSTIITTQTIPGRRLNAITFIKNIKDPIMQAGKNVEIIEDSQEKADHYNTATLIMSYTHNKRRELMFARYFSGPFDCSGFQYTVHRASEKSEEQVLKEIYDFVQNNTSLIKF